MVGRRSLAVVATVILGASGLIAVDTLVTATAAVAAQDPDCPDPGDAPGIGGPPGFTDANVAVFAADDFRASGSAAESEGLLVALGSASFVKSNGGTFNVGTVGAGSQIAPPPGSDMLVVGGDLNVGPTTTLDVGSGATGSDGRFGGNVAVAGAITGTDRIETNRGAIVNPSTAADRYRGFTGTISAASQSFGALTGVAAVPSGRQLTFAGDNTSPRQVFSVTAAQLKAATEFVFTGIPRQGSGAYAPVVVNVTGGPTVTLAPTYYSVDGIRVDDPAADDFGNAASALLWNLTTADAVDIGGTSQVLGSILASTAGASVDITASTNGRVYSGGDISVRGTGNELHNYPWIGDPVFDCTPEVVTPDSSLTLTKILTPGSLLTDPTFRGSVTCEDTGPRNVFHESWLVRPGETTTVSGLPPGYRCTLAEDLTRVDEAGRPVDLRDWAWAEPVWTVNGTVGDQFVVGTGTTIAVSVANTLLGRFDTVKHVRDPAGGLAGDRTTFTVPWQCDAPAYAEGADGRWTQVDSDDARGTVTLSPGGIAGPTLDGRPVRLPTGTVCTVHEDTPHGGLAPGFHWGSPSLSPARIVIGGSVPIRRITVTNTVAADPDRSTPEGSTTPAGSVAPSYAGSRAGAAGSLAATGVPLIGIGVLGLLLLLLGSLGLASSRGPRRVRPRRTH
ncbi:choice-of-anchor A family protein [uncultured Jatrophihabitans sp.]|uniref:choice-of-anchor A family protein n=1 Tax=uncultured Jatrophihabitans sp. TaxID=1610747 RepID=UPI0035CAB963